MTDPQHTPDALDLTQEAAVITLTLADLEIVNGWYWHKVDTDVGTYPEDDALYTRFFGLIDPDLDEAVMTDTPHTPDALDLTQEADRLYLGWQRAQNKATFTGDRADINEALRAWEVYQMALTEADRAAATFALGTEGVA